jgi:hypothetical protein
MNKGIGLLIPTRSRPQSIDAILNDAHRAGAFVDFIIGVDDDDDNLSEYTEVCRNRAKLYIGPRKRLGPTLNDMAVKYSNEYFALGFIGDDMRPRNDLWGDIVLKELLSLKTGFMHGDDGAWGEQLATQIFLTSDIVKTLGYMVPPGMIHMYLDNFWSDFARAINRFTYRKDLYIEHLHPAWGKAEKDALYEETNNSEQMNADRVKYEQYKIMQMQKDVNKVLNIL